MYIYLLNPKNIENEMEISKKTLGIRGAQPTLNIKETLCQVEYTFDLCKDEM